MPPSLSYLELSEMAVVWLSPSAVRCQAAASDPPRKA